MSAKVRGPKVLRGAFVTVSSKVSTPTVIPFSYNPTSLKRSLQPQLVGGEENDRSEAVRFAGAPVQTITVEIEVDVTDQLEAGDSVALAYGALPQLSALELLLYPSLQQINQNQAQLAIGIMEVSPLTAPRTLFVWGAKRVLPVRINSYDIVEDTFDAQLNPIRATLTIGMRVLNYSDLDSANDEYHEFMSYQQNLVDMAAKLSSSGASQLIAADSQSL